MSFTEYIHELKVARPLDAVDCFRRDVQANAVPGDPSR